MKCNENVTFRKRNFCISGAARTKQKIKPEFKAAVKTFDQGWKA